MSFAKVVFGLLVLFSFTACNEGSSGANTTIKGSDDSVGSSGLSWPGNTGLMATVGSPVDLKITLHALYLSTNEDCSNPILIRDLNSSPQEFNLTANPTLFSGSIASGTYKCMIFKMSDVLKYKVDAAAVAEWAPDCAEDTEYQHDIFRTDNGGLTNPFKDLSFADITAHGTETSPVSDIVYLIMTTNAAAATGAGFDVNQVGPLAASFTIPGSTTFYADFRDGILGDSSPSRCVLEDGAGMGVR